MVSLDQYALVPKRVQTRAVRLSDTQISIFAMVILGAIGGLILGGLVTLTLGVVPIWLWLALIGVEVLGALFVGGATQTANSWGRD